MRLARGLHRSLQSQVAVGDIQQPFIGDGQEVGVSKLPGSFACRSHRPQKLVRERLGTADPNARPQYRHQVDDPKN